MKTILTCIAFAAMAGTALAQAEQRPADDLLSVKPIASQAQTTDTDMIRSKIERMGYTDVVDLSRDSTASGMPRPRGEPKPSTSPSTRAAASSLDCNRTRADHRERTAVETGIEPPPAFGAPAAFTRIAASLRGSGGRKNG